MASVFPVGERIVNNDKSNVRSFGWNTLKKNPKDGKVSEKKHA
jgi:hypothetical protein